VAAAALLADERLQRLLRLRTKGVVPMDGHSRWTGGTGRWQQHKDSEDNGNEGNEESEGVEEDEGEGNEGDDGNFPEGGRRRWTQQSTRY
jgi:hypothetical protein